MSNETLDALKSIVSEHGDEVEEESTLRDSDVGEALSWIFNPS
jgi:hypothetical protein